MKKLLVALGLFATIGLVGGASINKSFAPVYAEDETSEVSSEETSEESIVESSESSSEQENDNKSFFDELSQGAKDFMIVAKEILNQPIVIGGVSVTLGAIVVFVVGKLFSALGKKKLVDLGNQVEELITKMGESVSKQDYNALAKQTEELIEVCKLLVDGTKNVKVKEKAQALLLEMQPVIDDNKEFAIKEVEKVKDDGIEQLDKTAKDIVDIVNKD